jgi:hypothetical protein
MSADIAKCAGNGCKIKNSCYRYTVIASQFQSYFNPDPKTCVFFIDNNGKNNESTKTKSPRINVPEKKGMPCISANEVEDNI